MLKNELTLHNAGHFLEAICAQPDPAACVDKIIASKSGLLTLQQAVRCKLSPQVFNGQASDLTFLQAPDLQIIHGGTYLNDVVTKIIQPPIFWDVFRAAFLNQHLTEKAQLSLGWLLLQLCCLSTDASIQYRHHPDMSIILNSLSSSASLPIKSIA
ncbi:hypothetical protein BDZ97DRAFT_106463 [Flammula alnicola]|nr:hypothetical protein BDZ97DRAFT_106463 [Flammula alnicola]